MPTFIDIVPFLINFVPTNNLFLSEYDQKDSSSARHQHSRIESPFKPGKSLGKIVELLQIFWNHRAATGRSQWFHRAGRFVTLAGGETVMIALIIITIIHQMIIQITIKVSQNYCRQNDGGKLDKLPLEVIWQFDNSYQFEGDFDFIMHLISQGKISSSSSSIVMMPARRKWALAWTWRRNQSGRTADRWSRRRPWTRSNIGIQSGK